MGKTETAKMFARRGIPVYDADAAVHRLYEPGGAAVADIAKAFPGCVVDGRVDRTRLTQRLTADKDAFRILEQIVHPLVAHDQLEFIERAGEAGAEIVVLDIPLLLETGGQTRMDAVVVVSAPLDVQRARVLQRPGMTQSKLDHILARQMPDAEKRAQAHFVVETDQGLEQAEKQVEAIVSALHECRERKKDRHA